MEKRNSQIIHGQTMEQTRGLFCMCDLGVARCQSQHQYYFLRMSSMFTTPVLLFANEFYVRGELRWQVNLAAVN